MLLFIASDFDIIETARAMAGLILWAVFYVVFGIYHAIGFVVKFAAYFFVASFWIGVIGAVLSIEFDKKI
jgi:hypothetical protein